MSGFATPPLASPAAATDAALVHADNSAVVKLNSDLTVGLQKLESNVNGGQLLTSIETGFAAGGIGGALRQVETDASLILTDPNAARILHVVIFFYLLAAPFVPGLPH